MLIATSGPAGRRRAQRRPTCRETRTQSFFQFLAAPPYVVFRTLVDPARIPRWRVPAGMHAEVHRFDARADGTFRISHLCRAPERTGKTTAHADTYHGRSAESV